MNSEIIVAGYGGQGALTVGEYIARAGILEGNNATWVPTYGQEKRGGDANSAVVVSDGEVVSPIVETPTALLSMNDKAISLYADSIVPDGLLLYNSSLSEGYTGKRQDIQVRGIPCTAIASEMGNEKAANMVLLGAYVGLAHPVSPESVIQVIQSKSKAAFAESNIQAFKRGIQEVESCQ